MSTSPAEGIPQRNHGAPVRGLQSDHRHRDDPTEEHREGNPERSDTVVREQAGVEEDDQPRREDDDRAPAVHHAGLSRHQDPPDRRIGEHAVVRRLLP